jgi:hypothetical protein
VPDPLVQFLKKPANFDDLNRAIAAALDPKG